MLKLNQKVIKFTVTDFSEGLFIFGRAKMKTSSTSAHAKDAQRDADSIIAMAKATILDISKWQKASLNDIATASCVGIIQIPARYLILLARKSHLVGKLYTQT